MPETDILNPTTTWQTDIEDSMTPSYGFTRKRASTQLRKKAVGSTPWTRETQNTGHVFSFSWLSRSQACVERLKWYYEQYEDGYFTIVDWDGGGRHYVGRFTTEVVPVETANDTYDVQNVTFEEMPQAPMLEYPSDWDHDSVMLYVNNDRGDQKLATGNSANTSIGNWAQATLTTTPPAVTLGGIARGGGNPLPLPTTIMTGAGTAGDWAAYEYRGYGFQLWLCKGVECGIANVFLDGVEIATIDCFAGVEGPQMVLSYPNLWLDIHRVQVVCTGTNDGSGTDVKIKWWALQVMR